MANNASIDVRSLGDTILNRVESLILDAQSKDKPLEIDPYRRQLFELFVTADAAGYTRESAEVDLTAEGICRELGHRWSLDSAARESVGQQRKLAPEDVAKMRILWSIMRMWMEWTYAWQRWNEFHENSSE